MPWGLAIGAGAGLLKDKIVDEPAANRKRLMESQIARYSPWTGMQAKPVDEPNAFNGALQGAGTGASIADGMGKSKLTDALTNRLNTGGSLNGYGDNIAHLAQNDKLSNAALVGAPSPSDLAANTPSFKTSKYNPLYPQSSLKDSSSIWSLLSNGQ